MKYKQNNHDHVYLQQIIRDGFTTPHIDSSIALPDAVTIATVAVEKHIAHSSVVRDYVAALPKGLNTDCPNSSLDELVKYVANQKGVINKSDPALTLRFLKKFIVPVFEFERHEVLKAVYAIDDISQSEIQLFEGCTQLSRIVDKFWIRWFEKVTVPYQSLDDVGKKRYEHIMRNTLAPQYDYTVFDYNSDKGCSNRLTWAEAFPKEIGEIVAVINSLKDLPFPVLGEYFAVLRDAYACTDITKLEKLWTRVDEIWIRIPHTARLVPVHGMESGYEHPFGVSPEFRLEVRTSEYQELITEGRIATLAHAAAFGLSAELVSLVTQKLNQTDVSVFVTALRSGTCLNFRYAGQAVPNRQHVLVKGGRIFLDKSAWSITVRRYIKNIKEHCSPKTSIALIPFITETSNLSATTMHEYAHPVGRTEESDAELGGDGMKLCEEAKATLLGILANEHRDSSFDNRIEIIANTVGRVLRFMNKDEINNETFAPYVRENLAAVTMLFETEVITLSSEGVEVNIDIAKSSVWFDALREFNQRILDAYQTKDVTRLIALTDRYCNKEHAEVAKLIAWVNRNN